MPAIYTRANLAWASTIRGCRQKAGLDQVGLGKLVRMTQQDISKLEKGRRPLRAPEIPVFAKAFKMTSLAFVKVFLALYET